MRIEGRDVVLPLEGLLVVDLSRILAGPYCTMMLADMGARVIKVEPPEGDEARRYGPPFVGGESAYFLAVNRNKESIVADLRTPEGREAVRRLARVADVFVENYRPGTLARYGLDYSDLRRENPRLVYASISGFGPTGPSAARPGYDLLAQAMGGLMAVTGEPGGPPVKAGFSVADIGAGMWAAFGILAALQARTRTGEGQRVDTSLFETMLSWQTYQAEQFLLTGRDPKPLGTAHPTIAPYQAVRCRDQAIVVACGNDGLFRRLCAALKISWGDAPEFRTNADRVRHRDQLIARLEAHLASWDAADALQALEEAGVPAGPVQTIAQVFSDPQTAARDMVAVVEHPTAGRVPVVGIPVKLSGTPGAIRRPPPRLGEHTAAVTAEFGLPPAQSEP